MNCDSTYINKIYATIIEKISDLSKKLITLTLIFSRQGRENLACHGKEENLVTDNGKYRSALSGSSARIILNVNNLGYIGLICW